MAPHETYKSSMNELSLLFQNVDVHGEKRRALMKVKADKEAEIREKKKKLGEISDIERKMEEEVREGAQRLVMVYQGPLDLTRFRSSLVRRRKIRGRR